MHERRCKGLHQKRIEKYFQRGGGNSNGDDRVGRSDESSTMAGNNSLNNNDSITLHKSAISGNSRMHRKVFADGEQFTLNTLNEFKPIIIASYSIKYYFSVKVIYHQVKDVNDLTDPPAVHNTDVFKFLKLQTNVEKQLETIFLMISKSIEEFEKNGSGWVLDHYVSIDLCRYNNLLFLKFFFFFIYLFYFFITFHLGFIFLFFIFILQLLAPMIPFEHHPI